MVEKSVKELVEDINNTLAHLLNLAEQIEDHVGFVQIKLQDLRKTLDS